MTASLAAALRALRSMQTAPCATPLPGACRHSASSHQLQSRPVGELPCQPFCAHKNSSFQWGGSKREAHRACLSFQQSAGGRTVMASQPFTSSKQSLLPHSHMALQRGCRPISAVAQEDTAAQAAAARARLAAERELARQRGVAFSRDRITSDGRLTMGTLGQNGIELHRRPIGVPLTAPAVPPITDEALEQLVDAVQSASSVTVLTGAGVSTESNIPDYRGQHGAYATGFKPMTHQQFMATSEARARYWARSFAGWREFSSVKYNAAHSGLTRLQNSGWVGPIITQNVDRLHHSAGSRNVLELHGTTHRVICMSCGMVTEREPFQHQLADLNPKMAAYVAALPEDAARSGQLDRVIPESGQPVQPAKRPDGDVELPDGLPRRPDGDVELQHGMRSFVVPPCSRCGGVLKPNVVFFGDGIPKPRADRALQLASSADCLLVVGSSLMVYSAFRLAKAAKDAGAAVVLVSVGPNRADDLADRKVEALAGEALSRLASHPSLLIPRT